MTDYSECHCPAPHVELSELPPLHILGVGKFWLAAKPGGIYACGHGLHSRNEKDAREYAFGKDRE